MPRINESESDKTFDRDEFGKIAFKQKSYRPWNNQLDQDIESSNLALKLKPEKNNVEDDLQLTKPKPRLKVNSGSESSPINYEELQSKLAESKASVESSKREIAKESNLENLTFGGLLTPSKLVDRKDLEQSKTKVENLINGIQSQQIEVLQMEHKLEIAKAKQEIENLNSKLVIANKKNIEFDEESKKILLELNDISAEIANYNNVISGLEAKIYANQNEKDELLEELADYKQKYNRAEEQLEDTKQKFDNALETLTNQESVINDLENDLLETQNKVSELYENISSLELKSDIAKDEISTLKNDIDVLNNKVRAYEGKLKDLLSDLNIQISGNTSFYGMIEELHKYNLNYKFNLSNLEDRLIELETIHKVNLEEKISELNNQHKNLIDDINDKNQSIINHLNNQHATEQNNLMANFHSQIDKIREEHELSLKKIKQDSENEVQAVRMSFQRRIDETESEKLSLKNEALRYKDLYEQISSEREELKLTVIQKNEALSKINVELQNTKTVLNSERQLRQIEHDRLEREIEEKKYLQKQLLATEEKTIEKIKEAQALIEVLMKKTS